MSLRLFLCAFFLVTGFLHAAPTQFEASSLKYLYTVTLEQKKSGISGIFKRSEYGVNEVSLSFQGKLLPSEKSGVKNYRITFSPKDLQIEGPPYSMPNGKKIIWRMVKTKKGPRLYVKMLSRVYSIPPRWKMVEVEFEPIR